MSSPATLGSIDTTLGAVFIGFAVSCCLYGILLSQIFSYFRNYPADRAVFKILVILILLLETADQAFIGHLVYYYSISNYANPIVLLRATMTWSLILQLTAGAIVGAIVKCCYGLRVWRFSSQNIFITGLILLLTIGQLGLATAFTIEAFRLPSIFAVHKLQTLGTISLACGFLTDVVTAGALCFFLNRLRTGYSPSDSLVNSSCRYAINTGVLTSAVSMTTLILYNVVPQNNLYFIATYFVLSKLYAISFLATLNTRQIIRNSREADHPRAKTSNTNIFPHGTRIPSKGPADLGKWDKEIAVHHDNMPECEVPLDSYYPGAKPRISLDSV